MATDSESETRELRRLGAFALGLGFLWLVVACYAVHAALPPNPIRLPFEERVFAPFWAPEGWALFTKEPRQEKLLLFVRSGPQRWISASIAPHASPSNVFGLDRASRAQQFEADLLCLQLPPAVWRPCREDPTRCLESAPAAAALRNFSPRPTLCGTVGMVLQEPMPWQALSSPMTIPSRVAKLELGC